MKTVFHLVRHASHGHLGKILTGRVDGVALSPQGREEARALARHMTYLEIDALYASPRLRTLETAEFIAAETGVTGQVANELDEIDFGSWSGCSFGDLAQDPAWQRWNEERDTAATPAGDTMADVAMRLVSCISRLRRDFAGGTVALVSHSDVIKAGLCQYLGLPFRSVHEFEVAPASVTTLAVDDVGGVVLALNTLPVPLEGACA